MLLKDIVFFPDKKQTEYTYTLDGCFNEEFFDKNVRSNLENSVKLNFCKDKKAIRYLNYGFSEVHNFHYAENDEKPLTSTVTVDKEFCNQ